MASLKDLASRIRDTIFSTSPMGFASQQFQQRVAQPITQGISNTVNASIPGGIQGGFQRVAQSFQNPQQYNFYQQAAQGNVPTFQPFKPAGQFVGNYVQNRYIQPVLDLPKNTKELFRTDKPLFTADRAMAGLGVLGGIASFTPDPIQDAVMPVADFMKGYQASAIRGGTLKDRLSSAAQAMTLEKPVGLGTALTTNPTRELVGNIAELPLVIGMTHKLGKGEALGFDRKTVDLARQGFTPEVKNLIKEFAYQVETSSSPNKKNLGQLGDYMHSLAATIWGEEKVANLTNIQLKNAFDILLKQVEQRAPMGRFYPVGMTARSVRDGEVPGVSKPPPSTGGEITPFQIAQESHTKNVQAYNDWQSGKITKAEYSKRVLENNKNPITTGGEIPKKKSSVAQGTVQTDILGQPSLQTNRQVSGEQLTPRISKKSTALIPTSQSTSPGIISPDGKVRGFSASVQEAPKVSGKVKEKVAGTYTPKPNEQLMGEAKALLQHGATIDFNNTQNLDQKVAATIQEAINLDKKGNHNAAAALYNNLSEHATELGRGVQAFSLLDKMSPEAIALSAAAKIKKYNQTAIRKIPELTGEQVKMIAGKVQQIKKLKIGSREYNIAVNELSNTINDFIPSSLADKALTIWKAGLLTSLRTHERNIVGNTIMGASEILKDAPAAAADMLMQLRTGNRSMTPTLQGIGQGVQKGSKSMVDVMKFGYDPEEAISKFEVKRINWGDSPVGKFLKGATDAVFRPLSGEDKIFWHSSYSHSLFDQAATVALNTGRKGDKAFIENLVHNPTPEMAATALKEANYATFHDKSVLSSIANSIKNAAKKIPGLGGEGGKIVTEVLAPFTGVPSSIVGKTIDYSPIGLVKGAINVGRVIAGQVPELQRQAAQEIGRGVIGTGLFGIGAYLMSKGLMTGQPKDTKEAQLWQAQNKPSNSVFIGGKWRSIGSVGPQNLVMLAGAKFQEEMNKQDGSLAAYAAGLGKDQLSQTFLQGVQQPLAAINDPARYGKSYVGNTASSLIPNIVKDASRSLDPYARETNTIGDYIKSGIPGLRNTMLPKRDVLGNIVPQEPTGIGAFFDLFNSKSPIDNKIVNELNRLSQTGNDATPSKLTQNQTILKQKIKLTFDQLNQLEAGVGEALKPQLESLINSNNYQMLDDEQKAQAIDKVVQSVRKQYKNINFPSQSRGGSKQATSGEMIPIVNKDGNVNIIDTSFQPTPPKMTGLPELDKKAISKFNGEITQKANDIYDLYKAGKITQDEANTQLSELKALKASTGTGKAKKIAMKKITAKKIKISLPKTKMATFKISAPPKMAKGKKTKTIKIAKVKPIKIGKLKGLTKA